MKTLLVHIGPHKTGSTAIQRVLASQSPQLAAQGWNVETFPHIEDGSAHRLADLLAAKRYDATKPYFEYLARNENSVILSSENFSRLGTEQAQFFAQAVNASEVRVVYYLRNPLHRLQSAWRERVKHGYRFSFVEFIAGRLLKPYLDTEVNDFVRIAPWRDAFSADCLDIHLYDKIDEVSRHFVERYTPGIASSVTYPTERINKSIGTIRIEIYRALSGYQVYLSRKHNYREDINAIHAEAKRVLEEGSYQITLPFSLDNPVVRMLERRLADEFREQIHPRPAGDSLFEERKVMWESISPAIWFENRSLAVSVLDLRDKIKNDCGEPVFDQRLAGL